MTRAQQYLEDGYAWVVDLELEKFFDRVNAAATEFCNSAKHVQVHPEMRVVRFSEIFRFYTKDFVNDRMAPSLIAYVNGFRRQNIPADFAVEFIPYDRTINKQ